MSEEKAAYNPADRMMKLSGKEYLPVAERVVWFRSDYPNGQIETTLVELDRGEGFAMYRARVATGEGGIAEASGTETIRDFKDYIEKAETKAVGRALGLLGYGTAAAGFEEGPRVVDAPQAPRSRPAPQRPPGHTQQAQQAPAPFTAAEFVQVMKSEWANRRNGAPYEEIVASFGRNRARFTPDQYEDAKEELRQIKAWTPQQEGAPS